jgi:hypothetical protein
MSNSLFKKHKIFTSPGGDPSLEPRVTILENNEYKITYFTEISSSTGTITIPTGATILLDQFQGGVDAYVTTIQNGQPTGVFPQTGLGVAVDVTSFNSLGDYTLSDTPSSYPVSLIYILKIKAIDYFNLDITKILDLEDVGIQQQINELDAIKQDRQDEVLSGGTVTIGTFGGGGTNNDVRLSATSWYLASTQTIYTTLSNTDFLDITLSAGGLQRFVAFYGNTSNAIVKVEGTESEYATMPSTPTNSVLIGYVLVTDGSLGAAPDLSAYATINPRVLNITSSATPTIDTSLYDVVNITALATNITSMTSGLSGVTGNFKDLIINFKDNGVARTITWGAKFTSLYATLPTTTIIGKNLAVGLRYNTSTNVYNCWVYSYSI